MVRSVVRRVLSSALLFVVAAGGGGVPVLDILFFHGPDRAEAFRPHYEASSSSCHDDGCSICSLTQTRVVSDGLAQSRFALPLERLAVAGLTDPAPRRHVTLRYLSRAPPPTA